MRGPNAGGGGIFSRYYIPDTATQAYFLYFIHLSLIQMLCKEGP